jgi:hypothetical protein
MNKKIISILIILVTVLSCKKDSDARYCWSIVDHNGNLITRMCDKTEPEIRAYIKGSIGGSLIPDSSLGCLYYKEETNKCCWMIGARCNKNLTESEANHYATCYSGGATATKVTCDSCCTNWYNRYAIVSIQNGGVISYSAAWVNRYCGASLDTIFDGKKVLIKNTVDSLISYNSAVMEFIGNLYDSFGNINYIKKL